MTVSQLIDVLETFNPNEKIYHELEAEDGSMELTEITGVDKVKIFNYDGNIREEVIYIY